MNKSVFTNMLLPYKNDLVTAFLMPRGKIMFVTEVYYDYKGKVLHVGNYWHEPNGKVTQL